MVVVPHRRPKTQTRRGGPPAAGVGRPTKKATAPPWRWRIAPSGNLPFHLLLVNASFRASSLDPVFPACIELPYPREALSGAIGTNGRQMLRADRTPGVQHCDGAIRLCAPGRPAHSLAPYFTKSALFLSVGLYSPLRHKKEAGPLPEKSFREWPRLHACLATYSSPRVARGPLRLTAADQFSGTAGRS